MSLDGAIGFWERLPEAVRWVLFIPAVLVVWTTLNLLQLLAMAVAELFGYGPSSEFWLLVAQAFFSASIVFPVIFALAPRGRRIAGWFFYVPIMGVSGIVFLLLVARRLGTWGLLGEALEPPEGVVGWEPRDWAELAQTVIWLVVGTYAFRRCLREDGHGPQGS